MLKQGMKAPEFALLNQEEKVVSLNDYLGQKVVVYFYPKDNTPGCTVQACTFRDAYADYQEISVPVIGISMDDAQTHAGFALQQQIPYNILADTTGEVVKAYNVWQKKVRDGQEYMGIVRTTYLVDEKGFIEKVYENVEPSKNAEEILAYIKETK